MSGDEFADTNLGYVDRYGLLTIVNVPEKCADSMISSDTLNPGYVYTAGPSLREKNPSLFRIETKKILGSGNLITQGIISNYSRKLEEDVKAAWLQFKNDYCLYNSSSDSFSSSDFVFYLNDIQNRGATKYISTALYVALTSLFLNKPVKNSLAVLGSISLTGTFNEFETIIENMRAAYNAGAKIILIPISEKEKIENSNESFINNIDIRYYDSLMKAFEEAIGE